MCPKEIGKGDGGMNITDARSIHQGLLVKLMSGPGDSEGAMRRAETIYGLPYWAQWNLRHKQRATYDFLGRLHGVYLAVVEKSVRRDLEQLKAEQAKGADDADLASLQAEAEALLARIAAKKASLK